MKCLCSARRDEFRFETATTNFVSRAAARTGVETRRGGGVPGGVGGDVAPIAVDVLEQRLGVRHERLLFERGRGAGELEVAGPTPPPPIALPDLQAADPLLHQDVHRRLVRAEV